MSDERALPLWKMLTFAVVIVIIGAAVTRKVAGPSENDAAAFVAAAEAELGDLSIKSARAEWVQQTYITDDTEQLGADASRAYSVAQQRLAVAAERFSHLNLPGELSRKLLLLRLASSAPPPADSAAATELATLLASLNADYGKGRYCRPVVGGGGKELCRQLGELVQVMATSRTPAELLDAWQGWHQVGAPMRERYVRFVELANLGSQSIGFDNTGVMWRSGYDMSPDAFEADVDRLWGELKPFYTQLHAYVRARLVLKYGANVVPPSGPIPAHLLGNMWAQEWGAIYDLVAPAGSRPSAGNITPLLVAKKVTPQQMVHFGEDFFTSLGFDTLPSTFWTRSQFTQPRDRDVVCHASAWDIDAKQDLRIKMCIEPTMADFVTIHHELGHNFYQRAYNTQPFLFRGGANDGFHEAVGDAIGLAVTPQYLKQVGLDAGAPDDIAMLLRQAMDKVAFLPFALVMDKWRWQVFDGRLTSDRYNAGWWELREAYQGVAAPTARTEADFDPGAKYHIPANVPYARYFLARVLQFQFYKSMCQAAGYVGPLHRCSFFGSKEAGAKLATMLAAGRNKPWQEVLYDMTGSKTFDASAMMEYFAPLQDWLTQQNKGVPIGW